VGATSFPGEFGKGNASVKTTLPETNIAPENRPLKKDMEATIFGGLCLLFQ